MLNNENIGKFILQQRKRAGMTQHQLAEKLNVSFQAVSKWEKGIAYPNIEILYNLAVVLGVSVDEILAGRLKDEEQFSYSKAGVDISYTDSIKKEISMHLESNDKRVLNGLGPFASLYDISFPNINEPVLVLKSEEPGSKQKLAMEYGFTESICHDMINHLVNDIIVMGAKPLAVLDTIVCGKAEKEVIKSFIKGMADACRNNECSLVGGETSVQPSVVESGLYVLTASIAGIVEKSNIIDGSAIEEGDVLLAVASNGLHTNGYSLVRLLMERIPEIKTEKIEGLTFVEQIMKPHTAYYKSIKNLLSKDFIHGMAHITGGGIEGNLCRIMPDGLGATIDLGQIKALEIFKYIKDVGNISDEEMLRTFNCGVGLVVVTKQTHKEFVMGMIKQYHDCYEIGKIEYKDSKIELINKIDW